MKQLIILVATISIGNYTHEKTKMRLAEISASLKDTFSQEVQDETNTIIKIVILAGRPDQETKMECIYPTMPSPEIMDKLEEIQLKQNDWKL